MRTILLLSLLLGSASVASAARLSPDEQLAKALKGRVAGEPQRCINLRAANGSQIIDGRAIIFRVGSTLYVNTPRGGAETLRDDDVLVTEPFGAQLCEPENVKLLDRDTGFVRGFVNLGEFVPWRQRQRG